MKTLSWTPERSGDRYCAPACGGGCTWAQYRKAKRAAARLARRLGKGWKGSVSENLGWHFKAFHTKLNEWVTKPHFHVHQHGDSYWADLTTVTAQWHAHGPTPKAAVSNVLAQLQEDTRVTRRVFDSVT